MRYKNHKKFVSEIFYAALKAVDPYGSVISYKDKILSTYNYSNYKRLLVMGFGKAACQMAKATEDFAVDLIETGIVITKYGHYISQELEVRSQESKIKIFEAGHPVPDENGLRGTREIIKLMKGSDEKTLVVCLISGGGSALLVSPYEGITLAEKQNITELMLKAGANIYELNTVRKHISKVKGGRLAEIAYPARVISLILSDVIGDRLDVIASGPTAPDESTYLDALYVLQTYNVIEAAPSSIIETIQKGTDGLIPETLKKGNRIFERVENIIVGSNMIALAAAKKKAEELVFDAEIISAEVTGEAKEVGKWLAKKAIEVKNKKSSGRSVCLISGGETTVTVKGNGLGGRNMELALSFALEIEGIEGIALLSAGTDGTDGPTDAAGAIVNGKTVVKAKSVRLDPDSYLKNNDSYAFFKKIDSLFMTGPTGTNVMDMQIIIVG